MDKIWKLLNTIQNKFKKFQQLIMRTRGFPYVIIVRNTGYVINIIRVAGSGAYTQTNINLNTNIFT